MPPAPARAADRCRLLTCLACKTQEEKVKLLVKKKKKKSKFRRQSKTTLHRIKLWFLSKPKVGALPYTQINIYIFQFYINNLKYSNLNQYYIYEKINVLINSENHYRPLHPPKDAKAYFLNLHFLFLTLRS